MILVIQGINEILRFSLEVSFILGMIISGLSNRELGLFRYGLGIVLPAIIIWFWSIYMAPKSPNHFVGIPKVITEIIIFSTSILAIYFGGNQKFAYILAVLAVIHLCTLYTIGS